MAELKVPIVVHLDCVEETIKAAKEIMDTYENDGSHSDEFMDGFRFCCAHFIKALENIRDNQEEGAEDGRRKMD